MAEFSLFDPDGNRLYLNDDERKAFLKAASSQKREVKAMCQVLYYTGCRVSEALELTPMRVDHSEQVLRFRSLKKRDKTVYRDVPVPPLLLTTLNDVFGVIDLKQKKRSRKKDEPLWGWSRTHTWRLVKAVMNKAEIPDGAHKTTKGLRHGYGVAAVRAGIQLNMLQKWMGHADMKTTAIYANALGEEERAIAARMWA
jgi:integrase/recombinase XerD